MAALLFCGKAWYFKRMKILLSFALAFSFCYTSFGQVKRAVPKPPSKPNNVVVKEIKPTKKATIEKTNGDRLTGLFISGDTETIVIELSGAKLTIPLVEIALIKIGEEKPQTPPPTTSETPKQTYVNFQGALIYKVGGVQPLARQEFYLLNDSAESVLADSGVSKLSNDNLSFLDHYALALRGNGLAPQYTNLAVRGTEEMNKHIKYRMTTDFEGKGKFEDVAPGKYWVFGTMTTRRGHAIWNVPIEVKEGQNSIVLDNNNAATAF